MKGLGELVRRRLVPVGLLVAVVATVAIVPFGGAANPDIDSFELEGDAADGGAGGADWNTLNPPTNGAGGSLTRFYSADPDGALDNGFTTGGSKDTNDVSQWKWEQSDVTPAKNDIVDAYAATYVEDANLILYFGQNRDLDREGDANVGFWFLQDDVAQNGSGGFDGNHADGDLLVQSEFTNGGDISGIKVFKWQSGSLVDVTGGSAGECENGKLGTKLACAIVNGSTISTGWRGDLTAPYFFEGGLNVSALFPSGPLPCFSTFLTNTRTSQSETAQLKDFALGRLDTCGSIVIKKDTQPDDGAASFAFTSSIAGNTSFQLGDGQSTTFDRLNAGTYTVAEAAPADPWVFDSVSCAKGAQYVTTTGASLQIALPLLGQVECTYVNKRKPQIKLVKDFEGTATTVDLRLGESVKGTFSADGETGFVTVDAGTYNANEVFTNGDAGLYDTTSKCVKNGSDPGFSAGTAKDVTVANGDVVVCTFKNTRKTVAITTVKTFVGSASTISIAAGPSSKSISGNDSVAATVEVGKTYTFSETLSDAQKALYVTTVQCTGEQSTTAGVYAKDVAVGTTPVTCTFVNTRATGTLEVNKDFVGTAGVQVRLKRDATVIATVDADYDGSPATVETGTYTVSEEFVNAAEAALYDKEIRCYLAGQQPGAYQPASSQQVVVGPGEARVCDLRNTRRQVSVTVQKQYVGTPTTVELYVGQKKGNASQNGDQVADQIEAGTGVTVGETSVPTGYDAFIACGGEAETAGSSKTLTNVTSDVTCVVTNKALPKVSVTKQLVPETDPGRFNLQVNGQNVKTDAGDGGTTGAVVVTPGTVTVAETAGTGTSLADYAAQVSCDSGKGDGAAGATSHSFAVGYGDVVACTITNGRDTGTIEIKKVYVTPQGQTAPSPYASVALRLDGATRKTVSTDDTTGALTVPTGSHTVAEAFVDAAKADLYDSVVACTAGGEETGTAGQDGRSATVDVVDGGAVVCVFTNTRKPSSLTVDKTALTTSLPEPGGVFTYQVVVTNTSPVDNVTLTAGSFVDVPALDAGSLDCPQAGESFADGSLVLDPGESVTCTFRVTIVGQPGTYPDTLTVTGTDEDGRDVVGSDDAEVTITDVLPAITVTKDVTGTTSRQVPGGPFSYRVTIVNESLIEDVTITSLADFVDTDGSLNGTGTPGSPVTLDGLDCVLPFTIAKGGSKVCTFTANVSGAAGTHFDVVVVSGTDDDENTVSGDDDASVTLTQAPPPPPPPPAPNPTIDVSVVKDATATVTLGSNRTATIEYRLLVRNNGPNQATNVTVADAAPTGVVFGAITKQPDFGTCTVGPALLTCNLGTMGPGVQTLIVWNATVSLTGTIVNSATATGSGGADTNPANNTDDAQTVVVAPLNPPTPKPKPKPQVKAEVCSTLKVTQKLLRATGKKQVIRAVVLQGRKPVAGAVVTIVGPGIRLTVRTNARGVAVATVTPKRAGIIKVTIRNKKPCNTQRIGVIGVFEPPVTG